MTTPPTMCQRPDLARPEDGLRQLKLGTAARHPARTARPGPPTDTCPTPIPRTGPGRRGHPPRNQLRRPRARAAGLDPAMRLDTWDATAAVRYDRTLWTELTTLRFLDAGHGALILGPVGVGKTHLATALGHIAVRRRTPCTDRPRRQTVHPAPRRPPRQHRRSRDPPAGRRPTCSSSTTSPCNPWTPPTPPTSTNSSSNATRKPPPSSPPTADPTNG